MRLRNTLQVGRSFTRSMRLLNGRSAAAECGAIAGNAGKGVAIGAATGSLFGGMRHTVKT